MRMSVGPNLQRIKDLLKMCYINLYFTYLLTHKRTVQCTYIDSRDRDIKQAVSN